MHLRIGVMGVGAIAGVDADLLRIGRRGSEGFRVEVAYDPFLELVVHGVEDPSELEGELLIWWSIGDARMEVDAPVTFEHGRHWVDLSGRPRREQERRHRRVRMEVPVWLFDPTQRREYQATTTDVSIGGFALHLPNVEDLPEIGRHLIGVATVESSPLGVSGTVVRHGPRQALSLAFSGLGAAAESALAAAIRSVELTNAR